MSVALAIAPVLPADLAFVWADRYADVPVLIMVLVAAGLAIRRGTSARERVFWRLMAGCTLAWLAVRGLSLFVPREEWGAGADLGSDILYLVGYLCVALALGRRPDRHPGVGGRGELQRVEQAGVLVFVFGLLAYFVLIPSVFSPEVYVSSLALFAVLDGYLLSRGVSLLRGKLDPAWRLPLKWLTVAFALWLVGDVIEGLMLADVLPYAGSGTPLDLLWHLPALALLIAVRSRKWRQPATPFRWRRSEEVLERLAPNESSLALYAMTLPAVHLFLSFVGLEYAPTASTREALVFGYMAVMVALLAVHQRRLRRIARRLEADRNLVSTQLQVSQRMEAVGRLAAGVAHDFSNVLSVIRGRADLMRADASVGEGPRAEARFIADAARRGESLVSKLKSISRRPPAEPRTLDLSEAVTELRGLLDGALPERVDLRWDSLEAGAMILADRAQVEQMLLNLVLNARDAMEGSGEIRIAVATEEVDDTLATIHGGDGGGVYSVLRVSDSGPGIPAELRDKVLEPFFTTRPSGEGSGLGLSIVYGAVRSAGGFLRIGESPGGGAEIELFFPRAAGVPVRHPPEGSRPFLRGRETLLLVEDYDDLRHTTVRVLNQAGYRVLEADSAAEALEILNRRNESIQLLVADLVLPDLGGFEFQEKTAAIRPGLPVLFTTGYPEGVTPLRSPAALPILEKPFSPAQLLAAVRSALDGGGGRTEAKP